MQADPDISSTFRGLNLLPGSKRKFYSGSNECREETEGSLINKFIREETEGSLINKLKRSRHSLVPRRRGCLDSNIVDEGLAKGLERHLLIGCSFQFEHKGSYT